MSSPVESLARWLDDRLRVAAASRRNLRKPFPAHWSFLIGEIALFALVILVATGIFLSLFYRPDTAPTIYTGPYEPLQGTLVSAAYNSVLRLSFEVRAGLLMRQIHHHAANVFVAAMVVHMFRTYFTGAFRKPRELTWVTGIALIILGIGEGFTGYSLPDDLLSGTGLRIAYSTLLSIPFIGPFVAFTGLGGEFPTPDVIGRLYVFHIMLLPAGLVALVGAHLALVWRQKHTQHPGPGRTERNVVGKPLFPSQAMISVAAFAVTTAVISLLGGVYEINPVWVYGPFETSRVFAPAQPDWYVGWLEGIFRIWPSLGWELFGIVIPQPFVPGVVLPGLIFLLAGAWPWIEQRFITKDTEEHNLLQDARDVPLRTAIGAGALVFLLAMFVAGSNDVIAARFAISLQAFTVFLGIMLAVGPLVVGGITYVWCQRLRRADLDQTSPR